MRERRARRWLGPLVVLESILLVVGIAAAQETPAEPDATPPVEINPLLATCLAAQAPEAALVDCAAAIASRQLQGEALAAALYARGMASGRRGDTNGAINDFSAALNLTPSATDALFARGSAYAALQRHDLAVTDFDAILAIDPKDADSLYRRAWSLAVLGRDADAVADLTAVLAEAPQDIDALMDRGGLNIRRGAFDAALADFSAIIKLAENSAAAYYNRGRVLLLKGNTAAAAADFARAAQDRDNNPYAALRGYLATALAGKPETERLSAALAAFPLEQWPLPILATLAGSLSEDDLLAAAAVGERSVAQRLLAEAHFYLGEAALAAADSKAAQAHFAVAAKGDRNVPEVIDATWRLKKLP
ncbi:MAG: tetratricopeptide repeat protein [Rhodospirillaceae bacterium]|nr:tetratricopeptide repeat protein [Rhodospirillaceae bacterium]